MRYEQIGEQFIMFARNNRWGTCVDCPKDGNGKLLPELCKHTSRYDHQLDIDALTRIYKLKEAERKHVELLTALR